MKTVTCLVSIGLMLTLSATMVKGFTIDGMAEAAYGSAISTQQIGTTGQDNNTGSISAADGSELDAAYGVISNGVLYLILAGNLDSGAGDGNANDNLNLFFMVDTGAGGDHTLGTNYSTAADFGQINRMGVGGNGTTSDPGLTFDPGFAANYWIGVNIGTSLVMNANYEVICSNCPGAFLGNAMPTNGVLSGGSNPFGIQVALNNINIVGVDAEPCATNAEDALQSISAAAVRTGVELAIPLAAIGSPQSNVTICAFITDNLYSLLYDQVLGPVATNGCLTVGGLLLSPDGNSSDVNFGNLPGQHSFTLVLPPCNSLSVSPTGVSFGSTGGTSNETVTLTGACDWTASSSVPWITFPSGDSGVGSGTFTYSVAANTSINPRTGTLTIVGTSVALTQTVSITQGAPPLGSIIVDGTVDVGYGCPVAVQQIGTSYGKNTSTNILNATGSELDASYGLVQNNVLFLLLAGNLQANGNRVHIFFMTGPGGTNVLVGGQVTNVDVITGRSVLSWMGPTNSPPGSGLTFDPGFAPNYWMDVNCTSSQVFFSYAQLWPGGTNASGVATNGYYLGANGGAESSLVGGTNPFGIEATINNSNTNGVDDGNKAANGFVYGCDTNAEGVQGGETAQALTVSTGIELGIPLAAFGSPTGTIAICAFVSNQSGLQMSDQILGPFGTNGLDFCMTGPGKFTNTPYVVLSDYPGQHYFYVGPEMRVTSISLSNTDVHVTYLTENNTNLLYRLERTTAPLSLAATNNAVWTPVLPININGTGGFISAVDTKAGTNKPPVFYRVQQTPNCTPP